MRNLGARRPGATASLLATASLAAATLVTTLAAVAAATFAATPLAIAAVAAATALTTSSIALDTAAVAVARWRRWRRRFVPLWLLCCYRGVPAGR